jgi:hypothetical protein
MDQPTLVDQLLVARAEQDQIVHAGLAPVQPVLDIMSVQESLMRTARKAAAPVAQALNRTPPDEAVGWPWAVIRPGLPQIRTCRFPASGSSSYGFVAGR